MAARVAGVRASCPLAAFVVGSGGPWIGLLAWSLVACVDVAGCRLAGQVILLTAMALCLLSIGIELSIRYVGVTKRG